MPIPIAGEPIASSYLGQSYDYEYPYGLDLRPNSALHKKIISEVMMRMTESYSVMSTRYPDWAKIDETSTAYVQPDAKELAVKSADSRKPISIVVPQSYAMLEIMLAYLIAALLDGTIMRYEGRGPEDQYGGILLEKIIEWQCDTTKAFLALYILLQDGLKYGLSAIAPTWTRKYHTVARRKKSFFGFPTNTREHIEELYYEGNELETIDPYLYYPDVNVSAHKAQEGEYLGWIESTNIHSLLMRERNDDDIFNVLYMKDKGSCTSKYYNPDASGRNTRSGIVTGSVYGTGSSTRSDILWMNIDLIPKEWKLPGGLGNRKGNYPETWLFGIGGDTIVVHCKRVGLNHGQKPIIPYAPDFDGHSAAPISRMEIVNGLQTTLDWLFSSHITNVRKAINDMLIVDPSLINMKDLSSPEPGKLIRLKRAVWGRGVKDAVMQLKVEDITRGNIADASIVGDLIKNLGGSVDALSGIRRKTAERVTAEEVRSDRTSGISRLEKLARITSWQVFRDLAYQMASNTQQLMSEEQYIKVTGGWSEVLMKEYGKQPNEKILVSPFDLMIPYDIVCKDGSIPGGNFSEAWVQFLPQILQDQEVRQGIDVLRLVKYIIRSMGVKNIDQFDRTPMPSVATNVMPNETVESQVQQGNLIPVGEAV
jgi:hypothetical protein